MKKFLLLASLAALAAFAAPAAASASPVWGPAGTTSSLDATNPANLTKFVMPQYTMSWTCTGQHLGLSLRKPASSVADVTSATFSGCKGEGSLRDCTITQTATGLPWTLEAVTLTNIKLNVPNLNVKFSNTVGDGTPCAWLGAEFAITGTLSGGSWDASAHSISYVSAPGLTVPFLSNTPLGVYLKPVNAAKTLTLS